MGYLKSFIACAIAVFCLCAANEVAAQGAPLRLQDATILAGPQRLRARPRVQTYAKPDPVKDGLIKGAVAGLIVAVLLDTDLGGEESLNLEAKDWAAMIAMGAGYGLVIDFLHPSRQPNARPGAQRPAIGAKFKLRF